MQTNNDTKTGSALEAIVGREIDGNELARSFAAARNTGYPVLLAQPHERPGTPGQVMERSVIDAPPPTKAALQAAAKRRDFASILERAKLKAAAAPHEPLFKSKRERPKNWS